MATKAANDPVVITEPRDNHLSSIAQPADQREISKLAYQLWQARGCPEGSPDEDWLEAEGQMQDRSENGWRMVSGGYCSADIDSVGLPCTQEVEWMKCAVPTRLSRC